MKLRVLRRNKYAVILQVRVISAFLRRIEIQCALLKAYTHPHEEVVQNKSLCSWPCQMPYILRNSLSSREQTKIVLPRLRII